MVRWLYILSICVMLAAGGVSGLCWREHGRKDVRLEEIRGRPGAAQMFWMRQVEPQASSAKVWPLVAQAQAYALLLNPPKAPERPSIPVQRANFASAVPPVRPMAPSANFKVYATSYYPNEPNRSMALIAEPGVANGQPRWMKEETQIGHFVIQQIRRGMIVYRDGEQLREMAVERGASMPSLVRDTRLGSRQVSAAVGGGNGLHSASIDTNSIEVGRN